jgi:hypothetical protein
MFSVLEKTANVLQRATYNGIISFVTRNANFFLGKKKVFSQLFHPCAFGSASVMVKTQGPTEAGLVVRLHRSILLNSSQPTMPCLALYHCSVALTLVRLFHWPGYRGGGTLFTVVFGSCEV